MTTALATPPAVEGHAHIVADPDLRSIRKSLEGERDDLIDLEDNFKYHALGKYLRIGLQCLKAHAIFAIGDDQREGIGGRGKKTPSTVDGVSPPTSFEGWLAAEVPWLPKGTAYRYKRAAAGLGVTPESDPTDVDQLLIQARQESEKPLSLTLLANRVPLALPEPAEESDPNGPEDKAGEARVQITTWIDHWDRFERSGGLEEADIPTLKNLEEFHRNTLDRITRRLKSAR